MGVLFGAKVIILLTNPSRLLKKRAKSPTINAAMIVPSRTPSMLPAIIREAAQARSASVVSKPILVIPNSFPVRKVMAFTKASPDSITTLAITSILTPRPSIAQPVISDRICEA